MLENYRDSLFNNKVIMRLQKRFKRDHHDLYIEEINKIALNYTDDKRLETFDGIMTYAPPVQMLLKYVKVKC